MTGVSHLGVGAVTELCNIRWTQTHERRSLFPHRPPPRADAFARPCDSRAGGASLQSHDRYSNAPECEAFAAESKALIEEWYPKINVILFGEGHRLPSRNVTLIFEPMKGVAATSKDTIRISAEWVTKKAPNDYGMVIHELTHIVQDYRGKGEGWLTEGIADYIRDRHFEKRQHRIDPRRAATARATASPRRSSSGSRKRNIPASSESSTSPRTPERIAPRSSPSSAARILMYCGRNSSPRTGADPAPRTIRSGA